MADDWTSKPYAPWLEGVIRDLVEIDPLCIAMQMISKDGDVCTCYWNVNANDRAMMMGGMADDNRMEWMKNHREELKALLDGEDGDGESDE